jgi:hypothetical protein
VPVIGRLLTTTKRSGPAVPEAVQVALAEDEAGSHPPANNDGAHPDADTAAERPAAQTGPPR